MTPLTAKQRLEKALREMASFQSPAQKKSELDALGEIIQKLNQVFGNITIDDVSFLMRELKPFLTRGPMGLRGEKGDKGDTGDPGPEGKRGPPGVDGADGRDGTDGRDGRDGRDGIANMGEVKDMCEEHMDGHEKKFDHKLIHDPKILGTKTVNESNAADGRVLQLKGSELVYADLPRESQRHFYNSQQGVSNVRSITVTENRELDSMGIYVIDASSGNITITVPSASGRENHWFELIRIDSSNNTVSINPTGSETMSGMTDYQLVDQWSTITLFAYNGNYLMRHV